MKITAGNKKGIDVGKLNARERNLLDLNLRSVNNSYLAKLVGMPSDPLFQAVKKEIATRQAAKVGA